MSAEKWRMVSLMFYMIAGLWGSLGFVLFFGLRIWKVIGDLSGYNRKRGIRAIFHSLGVCVPENAKCVQRKVRQQCEAAATDLLRGESDDEKKCG